MIGGNTVYVMQSMAMRNRDFDTWETRPEIER